MGNVLDALPKSAQPGARAAFAEIYNAEHRIHLRNRVTKVSGCRVASIATAFKLFESTPMRWRAVNTPHLVERPDESGDDSTSRGAPIHRFERFLAGTATSRLLSAGPGRV